MMRATWERIDPKHRRIVAVAAGAGMLFGTIALFAGEGDAESRRHDNRNEVVRNVLTDKSTRDVSLDGMAAQIKIANDQADALRKEVDNLRRELARDERRDTQSAEVEADIAELREQLDVLTAQNMDLLSRKGSEPAQGAQLEDEDSEWADYMPEGSERQIAGGNVEKASLNPDPSPEEVFRRAPRPSQTLPPAATSTERGRQQASEDAQTQAESKGLTIYTHYEKPEEGDVASAEEAKEQNVYLPAGSILTGVLLNGMDAPTSQGSRRDPFPATVRVQHEAILPNRFTADVKECFLIVSGYGDLASERVYLRGETISCVREDGGVIEARLDSYAVGEDGKAGVRGRVVSKQGAMIARSMTAGFFSGAAKAFDVDAVPIIQTGDNVNGQTQYQSNFHPSMFQGAAAQGASGALERVAQFYIDMAEGIFPVVEVDAGRQIELIMTSGTSLQIRSPGQSRKG
ncbi:conjugal transfer pilus assembly protein TraB [Modicisalibacter xianhensis]|uniref:Conjugal transfer pilus assembly protein TraB n=1 Tax=Modicisalibacter xianhensis TaxID=442341 RepID=A0A4R8FTP4_9GAMM|nr:TrbI/VirB10 family protein [Halomonas xianhensis]TDX26807.1 conjugal transfer pilus assembly protein TraB [Halomonas xianhensis]